MLKKRKEKLSDELTQQKPLRLWPGVVIVMPQLSLCMEDLWADWPS